MKEHTELPCAMSPRVWAWLVLGVVALIAGLVIGVRDDFAAYGGYVLIGLGAAALCCVVLTRRTRLVAGPDGFSFRNWKHSRTIPWRRLSSLQFRADGAAGVSTMVVINDTGRKEMDIPVHLFGRRRLHDWVATLPALSPGRDRLLD